MGIKTPKKYREMEHRGLLLELIRLFEPDTYVEIGVKNGYTFNAVSECDFVLQAIAVDPGPMHRIVTRQNVRKINLTSDSAIETWTDPIDFLFIDGDHSHEQSYKDFINYSKFVRPHTGLICMHDTYPLLQDLITPGYCDDAWKTACKIHDDPALRKDYEIVTLPGPWAGLSIIRKTLGVHGYMDKRTDHDVFGNPIE